MHHDKLPARSFVLPSPGSAQRAGRRPTPDVALRTLVKVVLADRYPIFLDGMEGVFRLESDFKVVACCTTADMVLVAVRAHRPDVLLLDLRMPGRDGFALAPEVKKANPATQVIFLADNFHEREMVEALRVGVKGFVLREMPSRLLVQCARVVHTGALWVDKGAMALAVEMMVRREAGTRELARLLTPREIEVFEKVVTELPNKKIATQLSIGEGTVKLHLHNIYNKLNVHNRFELILLARDRGLV